MIKFSIYYPYTEGCTFDMDYYVKAHLGSLLQEKMGAAVKGVAIERGLSDGTPTGKAPYVAVGHILFESMESFGKAFGPAAPALQADVANYTNITPFVQISEVIR